MIEELKQILTPEIEASGAELVDIELHGKEGRYRLSVFVDTAIGISVEQCAEISRRLLGLIRLSELLGEQFRLEVSSPGIDRPLTTEQEFRRKIGKELELIVIEKNQDKKLRGKLLAVLGGEIAVQTPAGEVRIPSRQIKRAVQTLPW